MSPRPNITEAITLEQYHELMKDRDRPLTQSPIRRRHQVSDAEIAGSRPDIKITKGPQ